MQISPFSVEKEKSAPLNKPNAIRKNIFAFLVTYSPTLPNVREIIINQWNTLNVNNTFENVLKQHQSYQSLQTPC